LRELHDRWYQGETISYAIGQSYLMVSPLQILRMVSVFATHGWLPTITIIKDKKVPPRKVALNPATIETIRAAMKDVVQTDYGTGKFARVPFMEIGAKTGTAQNPTGKSHAWFAGFFPFDHPRFAMVTMIEQGGGGGLAAGTLSKEVFMSWRDQKGVELV
jgi:penicillin-binding protein 2